MKKLLIMIMASFLVLTGCGNGKSSVSQTKKKVSASPSSETTDPAVLLNQKVEKKLKSMTLEEKVAQMFVLTPESLTGMGTVVQAGDTTKQAYDNYPVGGLIYMQPNLTSTDQVKTMLTNMQKFSQDRIKLPVFTFVDEEGGSVRRVSGNLDGIPDIPSMASIASSGNVDTVRQTGETIGSYLHDLGFNCDFAPDADVLTNPNNTVIGDRSFGSDPQQVANMSLALGEGLESKDVKAVYKHFPGHGGTSGDTHEGYDASYRTLDELKSAELVPFQNAIDHGASFIMVAHISLPNVTSENVPASLSSEIITDLLRNSMGYNGIVITDSMAMGAIADNYSSGDAAVKTITAGSDMILMPADFNEAYNAVLSAVQNGTISEDRINQSVTRILKVKLAMK